MLPSIFTGYLLQNITRPIIIDVTHVIEVTRLTVSDQYKSIQFLSVDSNIECKLCTMQFLFFIHDHI